MTRESIVEKIKKLLKHTEENGSTTAEAASALALAQKLMFEHKIDESEVIEKEIVVDILEECVSVGTKTVNSFQWLLADELARHFACRAFKCTRPGGAQVMKFVGEGYKLEALKECYLFAYNYYMKHSTKFLQSPEYRGVPTSYKVQMRSDYFYGFLRGLTNELVKSESENALVVVESDELKDHVMNKMKVQNATINRRPLESIAAHMHGYQDGSFAMSHKNKSIDSA